MSSSPPTDLTKIHVAHRYFGKRRSQSAICISWIVSARIRIASACFSVLVQHCGGRVRRPWRNGPTIAPADIAPIIAEVQATGATSLRAIAVGLNERGIPTARGNGTWSAVQVARVLERGVGPFESAAAA